MAERAPSLPPPPLPERLRPGRLDEVVGQDHLLGPAGVLSRFLAQGSLPSLVLWGPPGCGKTTIARLLAEHLGLRFVAFSAVLAGVPELRTVIHEAKACRELGQGTLLFIDELHRFNKSQQDALLPHVESGTVLLIGATTENPSFALNRALLSRCRVFSVNPIDAAAGAALIARAQSHPQGLPGLVIEPAAAEAAARLAAGDGRRLLMLLDAAHTLAAGAAITLEHLSAAAQRPVSDHDRDGESHYDVASAFIKSMRASDVQAALYYLARQLEAGEDPRFVARRVAIFASEDVGLADPMVLLQASAALHIASEIGMPEAVYPLSQAVIACATAPKSNSAKAYFAAAEAVRAQPGAQVPMFLRNAPTALMKESGYGSGYRYDHDEPDHFAGQHCLPEGLLGSVFYQPGPFGFEKEIAKRLEWWEARRKERGAKPAP